MEYKCSVCGGEFTSDRSEEEAMEEAEMIFDKEDLEDKAIVCDDCWKKMLNVQ